jgi:hypothetical protein
MSIHEVPSPAAQAEVNRMAKLSALYVSVTSLTPADPVTFRAMAIDVTGVPPNVVAKSSRAIAVALEAAFLEAGRTLTASNRSKLNALLDARPALAVASPAQPAVGPAPPAQPVE